ncbi:response regulator transcription factor [Chloroflexota bacterium]
MGGGTQKELGIILLQHLAKYIIFYYKTMSGNVLIIDNTSSAKTNSSLLDEYGYSVDLVPNQEIGLQKLRGQTHDVVIVQEPTESKSWQLCENIRRMTSIPIIVISTNASIETSVKAIRAGADYFIRKPFGPLEFLGRIQSLLRRSQQTNISPVIS